MRAFLCLAILIFGISACQNKNSEINIAEKSSHSILAGEKLAKVVCASCHLFPEPGSLDKYTWKQFVLPEMANYYGWYLNKDYQYISIPQVVAEELAFLGTVPDTATLSSEEWQSIVDYFIQSAPEKPRKRTQTTYINPGLENFEYSFSPIQSVEPGVTLIKWFPGMKGFWYADAAYNELRFIAEPFDILKRFPIEGYPVEMIAWEKKYLVLTMGSFTPENKAEGKLYLFDPDHKPYFRLIADNFYRPVHLHMADLNLDGLQDLVVSEYGADLGGLTLLINRGNYKFDKEPISLQPGAIQSYTADVNRDGLLDIVALFGQGREGIFAYLNHGNDKFSEKALLQFPPTYGSTAFELIDLNVDGHLDIVYACGDNADFPENPPRLKAYHGIRILINDGDWNFAEKFFFPLNGVYRLEVADFNKDQKLDIAAVSYFADYYQQPEEAFVLLFNQGNWQYNPFSFTEVSAGRWMILESADIDMDGDLDIVLGAALAGISTGPSDMESRWASERKALTIMKNQQVEMQIEIVP